MLSGTNGVQIEVMPPPMGVTGSILTSNYWFYFNRGHLARFAERYQVDGSTNQPTLDELTRIPSLVDTNGAHQLATQWLAALSIDVTKLESKYPFHVWQVQVRDKSAPEGERRFLPTPVFRFGWGDSPNQRPHSCDPVYLELRGDEKRLRGLHINDQSFFTSPPMVLTNSSELLGPLPSPRHFVEELVGGKDAYETIFHPERVEAWLLTSFADEDSRENKPRTKAIQLSPAQVKSFYDPLLGFDSYQWTATKMCLPDFGLKLCFTRGKKTVEFRLCYECDILEVTFGGKTKSENFDFAHNRLVKAIQSIFPKDKKVQAIEKSDEDRARKEFETMLKSQ